MPTFFQFCEIWIKLDPHTLTLKQLRSLRSMLQDGLQQVEQIIKEKNK